LLPDAPNVGAVRRLLDEQRKHQTKDQKQAFKKSRKTRNGGAGCAMHLLEDVMWQQQAGAMDFGDHGNGAWEGVTSTSSSKNAVDSSEDFPFVDMLEVLQHSAYMVREGVRAQQRQSRQRGNSQPKDYMWLHPHGLPRDSPLDAALQQEMKHQGEKGSVDDADEEVTGTNVEELDQLPQQRESWRVLFVSFAQQQQHLRPSHGVAAATRLPCVLHAHLHSTWASALVLPPVLDAAPHDLLRQLGVSVMPHADTVAAHLAVMAKNWPQPQLSANIGAKEEEQEKKDGDEKADVKADATELFAVPPVGSNNEATSSIRAGAEPMDASALSLMLRGGILACCALMYDQLRAHKCQKNRLRLVLSGVPCIPADPLDPGDGHQSTHALGSSAGFVPLIAPRHICSDLDSDLGHQARATPSIIRPPAQQEQPPLWDLTPLLRVLGAVSSDVDVPVVIVNALAPHESLWPLITSSFNNPELADVEFVLYTDSGTTAIGGAMPGTGVHPVTRPRERTWYAHKLVLGLSSPIWRLMFSADSGMRESVSCGQSSTSLPDVRSGRTMVEVPEWCTSGAFEMLLKYIYSGEVGTLQHGSRKAEALKQHAYGAQVAMIPCSEQNLATLCDVLRLGDFYELAHLKQVVESTIAAWGVFSVYNILAMYTHAAHCHAAQLQAVCVHYIRETYAVVSEMPEWLELSQELRDSVTDLGSLRGQKQKLKQSQSNNRS
jgi:hypothetical protein